MMEEQQIGNYQGEKVNKYYKIVKNNTENESAGVDANVFRYLKEIMPNNFSKKVIVDLGSGDGRWAKYFASRGANKVYAVEKSEDMISRLDIYDQEKILPIHADMTKIPLKHDSVDIGFSSFSMMYFGRSHLEKAIIESARVLKNNGIFYIATNIINIINRERISELEWKIIPVQLGFNKNKISLENLAQPIEAYRESFDKAGLVIVEEKHFDPEGVEISDNYEHRKDLELEKVVFVLEKK